MTRLVQDGLDGLVGLGIEFLGFIEQRGVAKDDGEGVVELAGDVAGELAETDKLLRFDEFLEHHGLAADRLEARGQNLEREQIDRADRVGRILDAGEKDCSLGGRAAAQGDGLHRSEFEAGEVVAGNEEWAEIEAEGQAVLDGRGTGAGIEKACDRDAGDERFQGVGRGIVESGGAGKAVVAGALQQDEGGLLETAIGDDGLADDSCLAIEVIDAAAGQIEPGVGFQFLAGVAFADLAGLVSGKLVFKREKNHADGSDDLGHGNDPNSPEVWLAIMEEWKSLANI